MIIPTVVKCFPLSTQSSSFTLSGISVPVPALACFPDFPVLFDPMDQYPLIFGSVSSFMSSASLSSIIPSLPPPMALYASFFHLENMMSNPGGSWLTNAFYFWEKMHSSTSSKPRFKWAFDAEIGWKRHLWHSAWISELWHRAIVSRHAWLESPMDSACIRENRAENINKSIYGTGKSKQAFAEVFTEVEFRAVPSSIAKRNSLEWKFVVVVPVWRSNGMCHTYICLNLFSTGDKTVTSQEAWVSFEIAGVLNKRITIA